MTIKNKKEKKNWCKLKKNDENNSCSSRLNLRDVSGNDLILIVYYQYIIRKFSQ